jgi:hypothetical protein
LETDPAQTWIRTNLAHALLFQGRYEDARIIYETYKDERLNSKQTFRDAVLEDFGIFRAKKLTHPDMAKIERLMDPKAEPESIR